jgi:hypothetical protein
MRLCCEPVFHAVHFQTCCQECRKLCMHRLARVFLCDFVPSGICYCRSVFLSFDPSFSRWKRMRRERKHVSSALSFSLHSYPAVAVCSFLFASTENVGVLKENCSSMVFSRGDYCFSPIAIVVCPPPPPPQRNERLQLRYW